VLNVPGFWIRDGTLYVILKLIEKRVSLILFYDRSQ